MSASGAGALGAEVRRTAFPMNGSEPVGRLCHSDRVTSTPEPEFAGLTRLIREFTEERDWAKFHDPKSLLLALVGEVGELAELFQWVSADAAAASVAEPRRRARVGDELADVLTYLILLADALGIDLLEAARAKLEAGRARYPAEEMRGVAPEKE